METTKEENSARNPKDINQIRKLKAYKIKIWTFGTLTDYFLKYVLIYSY